MIPPASDAFSSAPAAFGAYQSAPSLEYSEGDYQHAPYTENFGFGNYFYDHSYQNMESNASWMPRGPYDQDPSSFSEFPEKDEYLRQMHVNPAILDGGNFHNGYGMESGQTIANPSPMSTPMVSDQKGPKRSVGQPTNIVANGKIDRKTLKRMRNRVSASRCRVKKKEWINELEDESNMLHNENRMLMKKIASLEEMILNAKKFLDYGSSMMPDNRTM